MPFRDLPWHLCCPLLSSILFPVGLMFFKKANQRGAGSWTVTFVANMCAAALFSIWSFRGIQGNWPLIWQPAVVAMLFVAGQVFTFLAINRGDVSVATPVLSIKVVLVAIALTLLTGESLRLAIWFAACGATIGVALIQLTSFRADAARCLFGIAFAVAAASCFAVFDVLVQRWAPTWGVQSFLPTMFWMAATVSLVFVPWVQFDVLRNRVTLTLILVGGALFALQAMFLVSTIAFYSDAARINIVYSLRGLWGVVLAWIFASWLAAGESQLSSRIMLTRLFGALLLTLSVIGAIVG